jgi:hypothetical protein
MTNLNAQQESVVQLSIQNFALMAAVLGMTKNALLQ